MVLTSQQITEAALHLSERERLGVTAALWKSLGGNDEALADMQALARSHELTSGEVSAKTHDEVFKNARAGLG
ncbi:hypothetical protein [Synoicihabitans lomoniglobus]|uniref:Uncharacterized protein n=1 Tax=Synoicihabitans lomoniglobus TaxID=2909285 RepID=A0AAF0A0K8_9BACT|nr:hypothetical protein [Opitutaceae bacterium LMO-M01]WED64297.1 hypothetical protein PXH66_18320 [Opitutaceae bacterium LMO-M01]